MTSRSALPETPLVVLAPPQEGRVPDWAALSAQPWARAMAACEQDPVYHAEGDVWKHTRMVCEQLLGHSRWTSLKVPERRIMWWAALLHDVAKPVCSTVVDGHITAPGHARRGSVMARLILWCAGASREEREIACGLIAMHMRPFHFLSASDPQRDAIRASWTCGAAGLLALLAECDARGRVSRSQEADVAPEHAELFGELALDLGCYDQPFEFGSAHARVEYFATLDRDPHWPGHDPGGPTMLLMSGPAGAGKDSWLTATEPDLPVVSMDEIRRQQGIDARDRRAQGRVAQLAREAARELLRRREPFAWNATNLSRSLREPVVALARDYGFKVDAVSVEAAPLILRARNAARPGGGVPWPRVVSSMSRWEPPTLVECHGVTFNQLT